MYRGDFILDVQITIGEITEDSLSVSWPAIPDNYIYQVFYTGPDGVEQTVITTDENVVLTGLLADSTYEISVRANTASGAKDFGPEIVTTGTTAIKALGCTLRKIWGWGGGWVGWFSHPRA